jgi:hypothetical protein|tara:strand:- start:629 stop:769 length:141 start_codon:yes stop_codon:yes gene_type:complete
MIAPSTIQKIKLRGPVINAVGNNLKRSPEKITLHIFQYLFFLGVYE